MQFISRLVAAAFLSVGAVQAQQTSLLDEVHTVGAPGAAVPVELSVDIVSAGNYEVVLTDLGAQGGAALASVQLAVTRGQAVLAPTLDAPGTLPFTAVADSTYVIRVAGTPGALGSGLVRVDVRAAGAASPLDSFVAMLAPPPGEPAAGQFLLDSALVVPNTGSYEVSLRDLLLPQKIDLLLLAVVEEGGPLVTNLDTSAGNSATSTVTLDAARRYRVFSIGVPTTPTAGGLYAFDVAPAGGGTEVLARTVPVGGAVLLGSIQLSAGPHTLALRDLAFPRPLSAAVVDVVRNGQLVAQAAAAGDVAFTAVAGPHELYAFGVVANGEAGGSLTTAVSPDGQPAAFTAARVFPGDGFQAFTYEAAIANAANFRVRLADYEFPAAFQSLRLAAVQDGAKVGVELAGAGNFNIDAAAGKLTLLAVASGAAAGSLFGVDVTPTALGSVPFETTQGVGGNFVSRKLTVNTSMSFDVNVSDLEFPAAFANLSTAVTRGSDRIGLVFGGGTFAFNATPGNYFLNLIAVPGASQSAGTYAVSVTERPPPPVVTLAATPGSVTSSGGAVDLTWSSQGATGCTASGGWTGNKAVSGTERTQNITTATTFTLICAGAGGTTSQNVTVNVIADPLANGGGGGGSFDATWLLLLTVCVVVSLAKRQRAGSHWLAPLMAGVLSLSLAGCGGAQSRYARSMERGVEFLEAGDLDKARVEFRNAIQILPKSAEARYQTGVVAQRRGDFREALLSYKAAIDLEADYPEAQAAQARIFLLAGAADKAMESITPALARHPDHVDLLVARGTAYAQIKQPAEARADAERALALDPASESAAALLASLLRAAGERDAAIGVLEKALDNSPRSVDLRRVLANLHIDAGNAAAAEKPLAETVKLRPDELALRYELANFHLRQRHPDAAQKTLEAAVAAAPKSDEPKLVLAEFLATHRSREVGEKRLRAMISEDPGNLELRVGLAGLLERHGADQDAIATYQEIIEREPDAPNALVARNRLAAYYSTHGDRVRAQELIGEVLGANPRDVDALILRSRMAIDDGKASEAVVDLRTVLRDMPKSVDTQRMLARAHLANGEGALAEEALRKSLEIEPTHSAARLELAQLLIRSGRAEASVAMLEDAVRRNPTDVMLRDAMVRAYVETRDLDAAVRAAEDLQVLLPKSPMGFYYRGQVAQLQKDVVTAEKQYELALVAAPGVIDALAALSRLRVAAGRGKEAVIRVEELLAKDAGNAPLRNLYGELLLATSQYQQAVAEFDKTVAQAPKWWTPYRNLAIARYSLKDAPGAIRAYEAGIKAVPDEVSLVVDLAALFELQKRIDDAVRVYESFLTTHPLQVQVSNNLARLLLTHRQDDKSLARVAQLVAPFANARDPALLDTYGWSLFCRGDYPGARRALETAFARATDSGSIRYHLALVHVKTGDIRKAIDNLEAAVTSPRAFVGIVEARNLLADLKSRAG